MSVSGQTQERRLAIPGHSPGYATSGEDIHGQRWLVPGRERAGSPPAGQVPSNQIVTIIGTVLALLSIAGTLLLFINPRFDDINRKFDDINRDIERLEARIVSLETRMANVETSLARLDSKLDAIWALVSVAFQRGDLAPAEIDAAWPQTDD